MTAFCTVAVTTYSELPSTIATLNVCEPFESEAVSSSASSPPYTYGAKSSRLSRAPSIVKMAGPLVASHFTHTSR